MRSFSIYGSPRMFVAHGEEVDKDDFIAAIEEEIEDLRELLKELKAGKWDE